MKIRSTPPPLLKYIHFGEIFTERQFDVFSGIINGCCNKDIASELGISPETVRVHRKNVYRITGVNKVAGLINWYMNLNGNLNREKKLD